MRHHPPGRTLTLPRIITTITVDTNPRKNPNGWPRLPLMEGMVLPRVVMHPLVMLVTMINAIPGNVMARDGLHENPPTETENGDAQGVDLGTENTPADIDPKENIEIGIEIERGGEDAPKVVREKEDWSVSESDQEVQETVGHLVVTGTRRAKRTNVKKVTIETSNVRLKRNPMTTLNNQLLTY